MTDFGMAEEIEISFEKGGKFVIRRYQDSVEISVQDGELHSTWCKASVRELDNIEWAVHSVKKNA